MNWIIVFYNRLRDQLKPDELNSTNMIDFPNCIMFHIRLDMRQYKYILNAKELIDSIDPLGYINNEIKIIKEKFDVWNI